MTTVRSKILGSLLALFAGLSLQPAYAAPGDVIPGEFIVQVRPGAVPAAVAARHAINPRAVFIAADVGFAGFVPPGRLAALQRDPAVLSVSPNREIAAIAAKGKPGGGGGGTPSQTIPEGVKHIGAAPGQLNFTGAEIGVAIVDTGIDLFHADLAPVSSASFSAFGGSAQDDQGHGTHVAGIVAARDNSQDVVGVAPNSTLYAVKVLDAAGSGSDMHVIAGLDWVAANASAVWPPIRVVNMSLGRPGSLDDQPTLRAAVQALVAQDISVVVAAGNSCSLEVSQQVPATYPEVIAVASTTAKIGTAKKGAGVPADTASYFTTDGAFDPVTQIGVSISAPGEDQENLQGAILSSVGILSTKLGGGTTRLSGTSMAAPHVAGVVALLWEQAGPIGQVTSSQARARIRAGAFGAGLVPYESWNSCENDAEAEGALSAQGALDAPAD